MFEERYAASWQLAVQLVRWDGESRVFETHPGGGQYDCLSVASPRMHIDINRRGSIHAEALDASESGKRRWDRIDMGWEMHVLQDGGPGAVAASLFANLGLEPGPAPDPVPPHVLTYEVIAGVLTAALEGWDPPGFGWEALQQFLDTSGMGEGTRWGTLSAEMRGLPSNQVWVLVRGDRRPVVWLWDGWAWPATGERLDLVARHAAGASVMDLARLVAAPRGERTAPPLPPVNTPDPQPIGTWPRA